MTHTTRAAFASKNNLSSPRPAYSELTVRCGDCTELLHHLTEVNLVILLTDVRYQFKSPPSIFMGSDSV